ncbi:DNA polymerase/3'-5' exonuclease PolX [Fulvivirga maritima]|uniref:DNA polymerase/3'-5' exonuclease PolX n=1 Tax=Fulvivirga maritima TaxID=2904247 RepID=UPI001F37E7CC|nr:DNA polymerase/3'-5' exonuclease PolX [Fulvivirga maritima]UII25155.1 DNA polymerase/3'-5' exonuclease PolX [Fulvivirga maritima]
MDNKSIIKLLKTTAQLMELHGENEFKIKSYNNAIFNLEREPVQLASLSLAELEKLNGVGKSIAAAIDEINQEGSLTILEKYLSETPEGILDLLSLKGIGAKKIRQIWKDLDIQDSEGLLKAINEGELTKLKGFGDKTQKNLKEAILFRNAHQGKLLYAQAETLAEALIERLKAEFNDIQISTSGALRRKVEVIEEIMLLCATTDESKVRAFLDNDESLTAEEDKSSPFNWRGHLTQENTAVRVRFTSAEEFQKQLFLTTSTPTHIHTPVKEEKSLADLVKESTIASEEDIYKLADLPFIAPELREGQFELGLAAENKLPKLIEMSDLKGILHNHSTYSDGKHTLKEMADYCQELGYEYLGITDHSKSSFYYANGLYEKRVTEQQAEIDELNKTYKDFKIFKGIECDILPDGSLDYDPEVLASFDFIVSSVHSVLNMDAQKATERVLKAVENPFTTILGHMTGRLLLQREGYPVDHKTIIDACAKNKVVIEINANPRRLDIDWRWVHYALEQGVMLSINPDAHAKAGYHDMYYGLCVGRKGGLTKEMNLNSLSLNDLESYFTTKKEKALTQVG